MQIIRVRLEVGLCQSTLSSAFDRLRGSVWGHILSIILAFSILLDLRSCYLLIEALVLPVGSIRFVRAHLLSRAVFLSRFPQVRSIGLLLCQKL